MTVLAEILEQELAEAVEVKNKKSLHRYIVLLVENIIQREEYRNEALVIKSDIKVLAEVMKKGFENVDKRFEDINKRFEDMQRYMDKRFEDISKKFSMMFTFMNIGFSILVLITIIFKFIT